MKTGGLKRWGYYGAPHSIHTDVVPCELDTVIGSASGKVLFTMIFPKSGLAFSHLNSYPHETRGGKAPYDLFVAEPDDEGKRFLDALGIIRIAAAQVTIHPFLLGQKYQREADKAILRKNGVTEQKKTDSEK